jgi:Bifunctional DNA primase/polymerase, N-terminal
MSKKTGKKQTVRPLSTALRYASEGLHVVPLHGLKDGLCTCGNADCCQPGMHPRTKNGVGDATSDLAQIEKRWTKWSKAKIGIVFGGPGKLLGLMTDGETGQQKLREIIGTNGELGNYPRNGDVADDVRILGAQSRFGIVIERLVSLDLTRVILLSHHQASMIRLESAVLRGDAQWGRSRSPGHPTGCLRARENWLALAGDHRQRKNHRARTDTSKRKPFNAINSEGPGHSSTRLAPLSGRRR